MRCAPTPPQCPWPSMMCQKFPDVFAPICRCILPSKLQRSRPQDVSRGVLVASGGHLLRSEGARRAVGGSSGGKMRLQGRPNRSLEMSRCHRKPAKAPKEPPRRPQEHPKWAEERPKTPSRASLDPKPWFFENRAPAPIKPTFLKVGGSAWEFKNDIKRLKDEENNDFEEESERR